MFKVSVQPWLDSEDSKTRSGKVCLFARPQSTLPADAQDFAPNRIMKNLRFIAIAGLFIGCTDTSTNAPPIQPRANNSNAEQKTITIHEDANAQVGRKLFAKHDDLVVRESASDSAPVLVSVSTGHELVEMSRQNGWVEVGVARTGKIGWVPLSSTTLTHKSRGNPTPETDKFRKFMAAFSTLNQRVKSQTGIELFSNAEDLGDGILHVTATDTWLTASTDEQSSSLNTVYKLWQDAEGSGLPIAVYVRNTGGDIVMKKASR